MCHFIRRTKDVCPVRYENRCGDEFSRNKIGGVAVVGIDDSAELWFAAKASAELRPERLVQHLLVHAVPRCGRSVL